jgi:hypothetical protein
MPPVDLVPAYLADEVKSERSILDILQRHLQTCMQLIVGIGASMHMPGGDV